MAMIFVPFPRFVLPTHVPLFSGTEGPVDEGLSAVDFLLQQQASAKAMKDCLEDALLLPFLEASMAGLIRRKAIRKVLPACA
jgi:hypothetical protein